VFERDAEPKLSEDTRLKDMLKLVEEKKSKSQNSYQIRINKSLLSIVFILLAYICVTPQAKVNRAAVLDFDGDGKTDFVIEKPVWRGFYDAKQWWILNSRDQSSRVLDFGLFMGSDYPIPADYDGDGKWDVAVWKGSFDVGQGYFYILKSSDNTVQVVPWGRFGDTPYKT